MPFFIQADPENGVLIATCSGALGLNEAKAGAAALWANPEWTGRPIVWDFRSATLDVSAQEVRELARFIVARQPSTPPPRVAFVTAREVDFGMARMFEVFREHPLTEVQTFRDYDEALTWARPNPT